jgi:hypothetical protein
MENYKNIIKYMSDSLYIFLTNMTSISCIMLYMNEIYL